MKVAMSISRFVIILSLCLFIIGCSANKVIFPKQIEYMSNSQLVVEEFVSYIESKGYKVLNSTDTRMTLRSQNGFLTVEYLETDWMQSGVFHQETGNEYIIKHKVWVTLDVPGVITVESVFGYMNGKDMVILKSAGPSIHAIVSLIPEGLNNLVSSKSL